MVTNLYMNREDKYMSDKYEVFKNIINEFNKNNTYNEDSFNMALNIVDRFSKHNDEIYLKPFLLILNNCNTIKFILKDITDYTQKFSTLNAYKILSQIAFEILTKEVMGEN